MCSFFFWGGLFFLCSFLAMWGSVPLTPMFNDQLYKERPFCLQNVFSLSFFKNIFTFSGETTPFPFCPSELRHPLLL